MAAPQRIFVSDVGMHQNTSCRGGTMGRRSFLSEIAAAQRQAEADIRRQARERERVAREAERQRAAADKEARANYQEGRALAVESQNLQLTQRVDELRSVLANSLRTSHKIDFDSLRINEGFPDFVAPPTLVPPARPASREKFLAAVKPLGWFGRLLPGAEARRRIALQRAAQQHSVAANAYSAALAQYQSQLATCKSQHDAAKKAHVYNARQRNGQVSALEKAYRAGAAEAVSSYNTIVLNRSRYPDGFPRNFRVAYGVDSSELVVEYELPSLDIVPIASEYRYVKSRDAVEEKSRKPAERKDIYQDLIASMALRTLYVIFDADRWGHIRLVTFSGFVNTVDLSTGRDIRPCLVSVRTTRDSFDSIDLSRVDKRLCLRNLGAQISAQPAEMLPVKPIIEFDMVDKRFVEQDDVISALDSRPNLMDLNPFEFENLVGNLFSKMGLETKQTRASRDGGVDVVAYDVRPVIGGKVVIQAKRYRHTVGVSAVRDLFGTMMNEGANKGILVSTSGYGTDAYNFAKDKPIELIDGGGLLYLLKEAGVQARIVMPADSGSAAS